jgi:hypothetical protein
MVVIIGGNLSTTKYNRLQLIGDFVIIAFSKYRQHFWITWEFAQCGESLMSLRDIFPTIQPRESSGAIATDRFEYQRDWALCRILELHQSGSDYLLAFELHEDAILFDSEEDPTGIWFYQIKTRKGKHWTVGDLIQERSGKNGPLPSPLAKLYSSYIAFPDYTRQLTFVSNANIKVNPKDSASQWSSNRLPLQNICTAERERISNAVKKQCGIGSVHPLENFLWFEVSAISLDDHVVHAKGRLADFLEGLNSQKKYRVSLVYKAISDEIARRSRRSQLPKTFSDLRDQKALGRSSFEAILQQVGAYEDYEKQWDQIEARLNSEQVSFIEVQHLKRRWATLEMKRTDTENTALINMFEQISEFITSLQGSLSPTLTGILEQVVQGLPKDPYLSKLFDSTDIKAITLMRLYEAQSIQTTDQISQEEKA